MTNKNTPFDVIVIGGGQAGLSVGYHLAKRGVRFVILDAAARVGDAWRQRWDSLRLFSPALYDGLDGMPFPAAPNHFPTKDEMADYLESYAAHFELPVLTGVKVDRLSRQGDMFLIEAGDRRFLAANVVVAMASYQQGRLPDFARELDPGIRQLHSVDYKSPSQLQPGAVLLVGAGNSGAEIAMDLAPHQRVHLSGRHPGHVPFRIEGLLARLILVHVLFRLVFHRILTIMTPLGRRVRAKPAMGGPLIRQKPKDLVAAGVLRAPRVIGVQAGKPLLEGGSTLAVANVIWCTGFHPGFSWIDLPIFDASGQPKHEGGVVPEVPGLYFVGLHFLYSFSSTMIHGVGRDAERVARAVTDHVAARTPRSLELRRRSNDFTARTEFN